MATVQVHLMEQLSLTQECGLCMESSQKQLPCSHSFCVGCLRHILRSQTMSDSFHCPTCRSPTDIPPGGIEDLQTGFNWNITTETLQQQWCRKKKVSTRSEKNKLVRQSQQKCKNGQGSGVKGIKERVCSSHPEETLRFYCTFCSIPICRDCKLTSHEGHPATNLDQKSAGAKSLIKLVTQMSQNNLEPKLQQTMHEAEKHKKRLQQNKQKILSVLERRAEEIKDVIDQELSKAKALLEQETANVDEVVSTCAENMAHGMASLVSLTEHAQSLAKNGCNAEIVEVVAKLTTFFGDANDLVMEDFEVLDSDYATRNPTSVLNGTLKPFLNDEWRMTVQLDGATEMKECPFCSFKYFNKALACPVCTGSAKTQPQRKFFGLNWKKPSSVSTPQLLCKNCSQMYDMSRDFCPGCGTPSSQDLLDTVRTAIPRYIGHVSRKHQSAGEELAASSCRGKMVTGGSPARVKDGMQRSVAHPDISPPVPAGRQTSEISNVIRTIQFLLQEWD